jgi:hypothetical protein
MEEAGTSQADLADLRREAVWDPECVVRVDEALARDDAEEEDRRARRVPLARADLVDWMAGQPRSVWHEVALGYNWDDDPVRDLGWIVRQPDCDLATAIVVFLRAAPDSYMTVRSVSDLPAGERCMFEMLDGLARRIATDDFRHRDYRVDPDDLRHWRGMTGRMREEGPLHRWDLPLDEIARLQGLPTNAPFTFHDGELYRAAVGA